MLYVIGLQFLPKLSSFYQLAALVASANLAFTAKYQNKLRG
jgi:hypothetical protein